MTVAPRIAVLIPCLNEESTIGKVVSDFRRELPEADIYVFDNGSTDETASVAAASGATVVHERRRGKGNVVQTMFRTVDADMIIMVDGDDTYPAECVHQLLQPILKGWADVVLGSRLSFSVESGFHSLNLFGNLVLRGLLNTFFGVRITDILTGYRAMSSEYFKRIPIFATGFEIEAELTIQALERGYRIIEVPVGLRNRPEGSKSKLRRFQDGFRIAMTIVMLFRDHRPMTFFGAVGIVLIGLGLVPGMVVTVEFLQTGLVLRLPSAVLAVALVLTGVLSLVVGLVLSTVTRRVKEVEYLLGVVMNHLDSGARGKN